mgnify:CR=1 FL=1|jgi:hypothetical protein
MEKELECPKCGWRGKWADSLHVHATMEDYCPKCHKGELVDVDGVTEDDYIDQNPIERPSG